MPMKMFVELRRRGRSWRPHSLIVLAFTVAICSFFLEQLQLVGAQPPDPAVTTVAPPPPAAGTQAPPNPGGGGSVTEAPILTYLGDLCLNSTMCTALVPNSECKDSGDNAGTSRCRCSANYYAFNDLDDGQKEGFKCGKVLTTAINKNCQACEDNEGTCVEDASKPNGVFCECQISRSGDNCEIIHVNVSCSMAAMKICYSPHKNVDFADGWRMYTGAHQRTPQCHSTTVNKTSLTCQDGNQELVLSLNETDLGTCGTTYIEDAHNKRYMNKIEVVKFDTFDNVVDNATGIFFNVYCSFTAYQDQTFQGIGVGRVNGNDQGTQVNPNISFQVTDRFNRKIGNGVVLHVGDYVRFTVYLTLDGNYESLQILRVTASTSPVMPDSTAETRALMTGGCPVPGEVTADSWYWTATKTLTQLMVQSGAVPIFKMASSNNVFIHCALKLCMAGDNSCPLYDKATCQKNARRKRDVDAPVEIAEVEVHRGGRRKRAATNLDIQTGLQVEDPNASPQKDPMAVGSPGFIALLIILAVIAAVLIVVTIIVAVKTRRRKSVVDQNNYQPRPQLFALPRIGRTHERF